MSSASAYAWPRFGVVAEDPRAVAAQLGREAEERGFAEGRARGEAETRQQREALARALQALPAQLERLGEAQADALTEFAFTVARRLLRVELRSNPAAVRALIEEALSALDAELRAVTVVVNPADAAWLTALLEAEEGEPAPVVQADPAVAAGCVSVSCGARSVDLDPLARLEAFIAEHPHGGEGVDDAARCASDDADPAV